MSRLSKLPGLSYPTASSFALVAVALSLLFAFTSANWVGASVNAVALVGVTQIWRNTRHERGALQESMSIGGSRLEQDIAALKEAELKLKQQKVLFEHILETIPDQIFVKDRSGHLTLVNQAFRDFFGREDNKILGRHCAEFLPKGLQKLSNDSDRQVLEEGQTVRLECESVLPSGETLAMETIKKPLRDEKGEVIGLVGIGRDTTTRWKAEKELHRQKNLLELIISTVPDEIFVKDRQRRMVVANRAYYKSLRLEPEQVLGKNADDFLPEGFIELSRETDALVLEKGICVQRDAQLVKENGTRHYKIHKLPLLDDKKVVGIVGICRDVTQEKNSLVQLQKKDAQLHEQVARLRTFVENAPVAVAMFDREMHYLAYSRRWLSDYRLEEEDLIGCSHYYTFPEVPERIRKMHQRVLETGIGEQCEEDSFRRIDGRIEWNRWEIQAWRDSDGEIGGLISFDEVITDRKQAEEQFRKQEAQLLHASKLSATGELVAGIAHEINQPLYSILNYSKAVENILSLDHEGRDSPDLESVRSWNQQILQAAARGGQITQRMKALAKPADTQRCSANINDIVEESIGFVVEQSKKFSVQIQRDLSPSLPHLSVDRIQIQQVLVNLLTNAIESLTEAQTAGGRVLVSTQTKGSDVEVTIADNGPGIAKIQNMDILEPFQTTKKNGIGLGLAISNSIVKFHHGTLAHSTNDWGGATFRFTLCDVRQKELCA